MKNETIEALGATGSKTIVKGAGLTSFGWITSNELLGLVGAIVAVAGLAITWYCKPEANRRHVDEHELRMARLRRGMDMPEGELAEQGAGG